MLLCCRTGVLRNMTSHELRMGASRVGSSTLRQALDRMHIVGPEMLGLEHCCTGGCMGRVDVNADLPIPYFE